MLPTSATSSTKAAVICVRVSPRPAENVRYSPEIQEQKCREWCDAHGIPVVRVIQDILVSGADPKRFTPILQSLADDKPTHFVVSDISRFTRDHPKRYWAVIGLIEDAGAQVVSVDQPYLGSDIPFGATIATAQVEANYLQRIESNKKTSLGVRAAWASGKRFGKIWGWAFDPDTRKYIVDEQLVVGLFSDYASGMSIHGLGRKYAIRPGHVRSHLQARSQEQIVGSALWSRCQDRLAAGRRAQRWDARQSSLYRGLLFCPFCSQRMVHHSAAWNNYRCPPPRKGHHPWTMLSATLHVEPAVKAVLHRLVIPSDEQLDEPPVRLEVVPNPDEIRREIERLSVAWSKKRLSDARYEALVAELEEQLERKEPPPVSDQIAILRGLEHADLQDRDPVLGDILNALLREALLPFVISEDRQVTVTLKPLYAGWAVTQLPRPQVVRPKAG